MFIWASLVAQVVKDSPTMRETWLSPPDWEDPLEERTANSPQDSHLEKPHGQRSRVGYSPRGHKESDTTELLSTAEMFI